MCFLDTAVHIFIFFLKALLLIVPVLLSVAFLTLAERKVLGAMQRRKGPNTVGFFGLLQPFADALKLLIKETVLPSMSNKFLFILAPLITLTLSLFGWSVVPFGEEFFLIDLDLSLLFFLMVSSLGTYGILLAGWSSNSRYGFLGSLRSAAQMISYEVSMGITLLTVVLSSGSFNLIDIVEAQRYVWFVVPHLPCFFIFFISVLAETNRPPFDLPEAEAELVSGYNVEYSSVGFVLFFVAEYSNILLMSFLNSIFFFGGWFFFGFESVFFLLLKVIFFLFLFIWVRAALPRFRYDQLMTLGWKVFLPVSTGWFFFTATVLYMSGCLSVLFI